jgi:hypothetical protein
MKLVHVGNVHLYNAFADVRDRFAFTLEVRDETLFLVRVD